MVAKSLTSYLARLVERLALEKGVDIETGRPRGHWLLEVAPLAAQQIGVKVAIVDAGLIKLLHIRARSVFKLYLVTNVENDDLVGRLRKQREQRHLIVSRRRSLSHSSARLLWLLYKWPRLCGLVAFTSRVQRQTGRRGAIVEIGAVEDVEVVLVVATTRRLMVVHKRPSIGVVVFVVCFYSVEIRLAEQHVAVELGASGASGRLAQIELVEILVAQRVVVVLAVPDERSSVHIDGGATRKSENYGQECDQEQLLGAFSSQSHFATTFRAALNSSSSSYKKINRLRFQFIGISEAHSATFDSSAIQRLVVIKVQNCVKLESTYP